MLTKGGKTRSLPRYEGGENRSVPRRQPGGADAKSVGPGRARAWPRGRSRQNGELRGGGRGVCTMVLLHFLSSRSNPTPPSPALRRGGEKSRHNRVSRPFRFSQPKGA